MKGAWLLKDKQNGESCCCSSLPVLFRIAPDLEQYKNKIYKLGGYENEAYKVARLAFIRPEDVR